MNSNGQQGGADPRNYGIPAEEYNRLEAEKMKADAAPEMLAPPRRPQSFCRRASDMTDIVKHMHDAESRAIIDRACGEIAKVLSDRDMWKAPWRVEVDGCVFKFKIDGYPKHGTPKDIERQRYLAELSAEKDKFHAEFSDRND